MNDEKSDDVTVKIPGPMARRIQGHPNFKLFDDFEHFVISAVRNEMERYMPESPK